MTKHIQAFVGGSVIGIGLLGITAIPAFAHNHERPQSLSVDSYQESSVTNLAQAQEMPMETQMNEQMMETMQQMGQMAKRCNAMMDMMMENGSMPGMMDGQNEQDMMEQ